MILVNGVPCAVQVRPAYKFSPYGREYARLSVGRVIIKGEIALFALCRGRKMKLVIQPSHLRNVSSVYIPADGKYAIGGSKKTQERLEPVQGSMALAVLENKSDIINRRGAVPEARPGELPQIVEPLS